MVASEVKALSTQTAKATEEIADQIQAIRNATGTTAEAIREIGATIGQINEIATTIAAAVEEQGGSTKEIARSVQQAAQGTQGVMQNIADVTKASGAGRNRRRTGSRFGRRTRKAVRTPEARG